MNFTHYIYIIILIVVVFFWSCDRKSNYVTSFERFVNNIEVHQDTYSEQDWEKADAQYAQFSEVDYVKNKQSLTKEDRNKIGQLKGKYIAIRYKNVITGKYQNIEESYEEVKGVVEGFMNEANN